MPVLAMVESLGLELVLAQMLGKMMLLMKLLHLALAFHRHSYLEQELLPEVTPKIK